MRLCMNRQRAFDKLGQIKAGALFIKSGARKVEIALEFVRSQQFKVDYIVWIAPAAFLSTRSYKDEIKKWSRGLERKIYFYSIEAVAASDTQYLSLYNLIDKFRTFCVVDESITIKNTEAGRTQRLLNIGRKFKYRLLLSGTPLTQGLIDLYAQIQFINSSILKMTETQFSNNFLHFFLGEDEVKRRWSKPQNEKKLIELMRPYILEYDLDFDCSIKYFDEYFDLTPKEIQNYSQEKEMFLREREQFPFMQVVQKFQHIYTIAKDKVFALVDIIDQILARGEKVIVYIKFIDEIKFFKECGAFDHPFVELTGNSNKNKVVEAFRNNVNIMFSTYGAGGFSINVPFCNNIIFFSQTFDYKDKIQCLDCVYQKGLTKELNIYNFWVKTGLEDLIQRSLTRKKHVLSNICDFISKEEMLRL